MCPACDGRSRGRASGCDGCGGEGRVAITTCPHRYAAGVGPVFFAADQAEMGMWPQAGGWMDQTQHCLDAVSFVLADQARMREDGSSDDDD